MDKETNSFFELFYGVRRLILLTFYIVSVVALGSVIVVLLNTAGVAPPIQVLVVLLLSVVSIGGGAFLYVMLELPQIGYSFDQIKNDIAAGRMRTANQFSQRLVTLLCRHFSFAFFATEYAFIKVQQEKPVASDPAVLAALSADDLARLLTLSQETEAVIYVGKYDVAGKGYHLHLVPIYFGQRWLGYIGLLTHQKLWRIFTHFLVDFENNYVDDQLVHVLDLQKQALQKQFYREMDVFSDKIARQAYTSIETYMQEVADFLVSYVGCAGALFVAVYNEAYVTTFTRPVDEAEIVAYYRDRLAQDGSALAPALLSDVVPQFTAVCEIPIILDELLGLIVLFDDEPDRLTYFFNTLVEVEHIKLNSDLRCLALQLI